MTDCNITLNDCSDFTINVCETCCSCSISSSSFGPADAPGLLHWYKSDEDVISYESRVLCWRDLIGNSDLIQSQSLQQPSIIPNSLNGYPMVRFNSGTLQNDPGPTFDSGSTIDQMHFLNVDVQQPFTIFMTWRRYGDVFGTYDGTGNDEKTYVFSRNLADVNFDVSTTAFRTEGTRFTCGTALETTASINVNQFGSTAIIGNGANSRVYNNGTLILSGNAGTNAITGTFGLGGNEWNGRGGAYFDLVEMMIFTGSLSSGTIQQLTERANDRYAL